jgi:hypothetical protein
MKALALATVVILTAFPALATPLATTRIAEFKAITTDRTGKACPAADPMIIFADVGRFDNEAHATGGNRIVMPARFDPATKQGAKWLSGPEGHQRLAHEVAHTCGANETEAKSVGCAAWICDSGFNGHGG